MIGMVVGMIVDGYWTAISVYRWRRTRNLSGQERRTLRMSQASAHPPLTGIIFCLTKSNPRPKITVATVGVVVVTGRSAFQVISVFVEHAAGIDRFSSR